MAALTWSIRWILAGLALVVCHTALGAPLIFGVPNLPPDVYLQQDGRPGGIFGEIINRIANQEGWTLRSRQCTWADCMAWLQEGVIDLLPDVRYTAKRSEVLDYNTVSVVSRSSQLYVREGAHLTSIEDLNGKAIAVLKGSAQEETLRRLFAERHLDATLIPKSDLEETFQATANHEADAALADYFSGALMAPEYHLVATSLLFETGPTFYAAPKGRHLATLQRIDHHLQIWKADRDSTYYDILKRSGYPQAAAPAAWSRNWRWLSLLFAIGLFLLGWAWRQHWHGRHLAHRLIAKEREVLQARLERDQIQTQTDRSAFFDALTDLPNRKLLYTRIEQALATVRTSDTMSAVIVLDINNFRRANEAHGLKAGDRILQDVARRILKNTHDRDTVARTSGDEFTILLANVSEGSADALSNVAKVAETLHAALTETPYQVHGRSHTLRVSIGYRLLDDPALSVADFLQHADIARHWSRGIDGNKAVYFRDHLQAQIEQEFALEQDLKLAIGSSQLTLSLQSQYSSDGTISGAELLMRWTHPVEGAISPQVFIPIAEESDLIQTLTDWSIREACLALSGAAGSALPPISVNISRKCLEDPTFSGRVRQIIQEAGISPNRLIFEITESLWMKNVEVTRNTIRALREIGIRFSMDDFGTGYSNLAHLGDMPLYEIKIDKTLIDKLSAGDESAAIVGLVLTMGKNLGLRVVAEGVETREQRQYLFQHGCSAVQGYLLARPTPIDDWIRQIGTD